MCVPIGGAHFDYAVINFQYGDIKGSAAKVKHGNRAIFLFIKSIGKGRCGRFVDNTHYFKTRDFARVFGGLALLIIKVSRNGDYRFGDRVSQKLFDRLL